MAVTDNDMYPAYDRSERIADGTVHALGVTLALVGTVLLLIYSAGYLPSGRVAALSVYGGALTFSLGASAIYHFTPWEAARPLLRRIDHAAIYLKIAGTYTPLIVLAGSAFSYTVLAVIWLAALVAAAIKLFFWRRPGRFGLFVYLALGWAGVFVIWPLVPVLPLASTVLIAVGGLLYSLGVIFFNWDALKFSLAIWHALVLVGSTCFFTAIALGSFLTV